MITAVFTDNSDYARATGLWQWDYGQRLRIDGLKLPTAVEIHFALTEQSGDAITRVGTTKDGVTEVVIPDSLLENQAAGATYEIYAWIYLADKTSGETIKRISMQVKRRPKPEGRDTPEDAELFREAIEAVNASADRAETAREGAEAAQEAAEAAAGKIEGEITGAGQIAEQVKQDAEAVAKDKQAVSQMATETTQNAQKAAEAAQAAERSSTAAKEAQTAAESAKAGATAAMEEVERDRTEVSEIHRAVEQLREAVDTDRQAVAADRQAVENTALQFGQAAQIAINAVGQAQEAAVGAVSAEGQRQTTAVQRAGTQAVSDVAEAKTTAVQAVTTEGDTQTKRVQDAATGIVADREQIAANKQAIEGKVDKQQGADNAGKALVVGADGNVELGDAQTKTDPTLTQSGQAADAQVTGREIATLHQKKADAIVETAQGETMTLTDSSDKLFEGLRVFGKSTQDGTPSVENPVPIVNAGEGGSITVTVNGAEPQSLTLATPNGLPGVPVSKDGNYTDQNGQQWVCDEIDLGRGKYVQRVLKTKPNKTIVFSNRDENGRCAMFDNSLFGIKWMNGAKQALSSIAQWSEWGNRADGTFALSTIGIYYKDSMKTLEEVNAIFAKIGTDFEVCGVLATPIERDLTPEEIAAYSSLHANCPTTVITNDAGVHMEVSYVADTGTYIRNMESRLNAKLVNIQSALISQKISGGGIKVTDSSRVPVVRFVMWGKTEQVRTSGAQLLRNDLSKKRTAKGLTIELNNCMVSYKGTFVDDGTQDRPVLDLLLKKDDFIGKTLFLVSDDSKLHLTFRIDRINGENEYDIKEPIVDETVKEIYARFFYRETNPPSGIVVNETHKVMLCESKNKGKPWEPYSGGLPSPSPDWEQPIETTDQPVTITVKGDMEQQSITLIPPRPFTKWDKMEKVDGVWCWVYQHNTVMLGDFNYNINSAINHEKDGIVFSHTFEDAAGGNQTSLCTRFMNQDYIYGSNHKDKIGYCDHITLGTKYFRPPNREITTVSQFKEWLNVNPTELVYKTKESETTPLSPSEQAQLNALTMYASETEVTNTGGCNMELTYTVDTKSYVDKKIAEISTAIVKGV